ncbi:hypothetical protein [Candidatus Uabimicrobium sp. HlEnr_7]|uniref:hypothetical protein n=1 Tax=Candidatus Uabimicrobium helgolandensis TaxID=3095367 RepID=UPI003558CFC9
MNKQRLFFLSCIIIASCQLSTPSWKEINSLEKKRKFQIVSEKLDLVLKNARDKNVASEWRQALIRKVANNRVRCRHKEAVTLLEQSPWPKDDISQAMLNMVYADALYSYLKDEKKEINKRSNSSHSKDFTQWNQLQLVKAINKHYKLAYDQRQILSKLRVSDFAYCIQRDNYPGNISNTIRDFVSYAWVDFLQDHDCWNDQEYKDRFKTAKLMITTQKSKETIKDSHPLLKISTLLEELYNWNDSKNKRESALEAKLEKARVVAKYYNLNQERQKHLQYILKDYEDTPWWSFGMYELAKLLPKDGYHVALKGYNKYPTSIGGKMCLELSNSFIAPEYAAEAKLINSPQSNSIRVYSRNIDKLYFRAYRLHVPTVIKDHGWLQQLEKEKYTKSVAHSNWEVTTKTKKEHYTNVKTPIQQPGTYLILSSIRKDFAPQDNHITSNLLCISDYVILKTDSERGLEICVLNGNNGHIVNNANISIYTKDGILQDSQVSNSEGFALFKNLSSQKLFIVAEKNTQHSIHAPFYYQEVKKKSPLGAIINTNRQIYQLGQEIICEITTFATNNHTAFHILKQKEIEIAFYSSSFREISKHKVKTDNNGKATIKFTSSKPGRHYIQAQIGDSLNTKRIVIEKAPKPENINIELLDKKLILDQPAIVSGSIKDHLGNPIVGKLLTYKVECFDRIWNYTAQNERQFKKVANGSTYSNSQGKFNINFVPTHYKSIWIQENFRVVVETTDNNNYKHSQKHIYVPEKANIKVDFIMPKNFLPANIRNIIKIKKLDTEGVPITGQANYKIYRSQYTVDKVSSKKIVVTGRVNHDNQGIAKILLPALVSDFYKIEYETKDKYQTMFTTTKNFHVAISQSNRKLPFLITEHNKVDVGNHIKFYVGPSVTNRNLIFEIHRADKLLYRKTVNKAEIVSFKTNPAHTGELLVRLYGINNYKLHSIQKTVVVQPKNSQLLNFWNERSFKNLTISAACKHNDSNLKYRIHKYKYKRKTKFIRGKFTFKYPTQHQAMFGFGHNFGVLYKGS